MSAVPRRFKDVIARFGDDYTVGAASRKGIFVPVSPGRALVYLTQAEVDAAGRPIRFAYVAHDDGTALNDSVSWDGLTLAVKKVVRARYRSETVAKVLVMV